MRGSTGSNSSDPSLALTLSLSKGDGGPTDPTGSTCPPLAAIRIAETLETADGALT